MKLEEKADLIQGTKLDSKLKKGPFLKISASNIGNNGQLIIPEDSNTNSFIEIKSRQKKYLIQQNDILMVIQGSLEQIGKLYIHTHPIQGIATHDIMIIKPTGNVEKLYTRLKENYYQLKLLATRSKHSAKISQSTLENHEF